MPSIIWFRRDLRLRDHPALAAALADGPAAPVFVIDEQLWGRSGQRRRGYLAASLRSLHQDIAELGGPGLTVLRGDPAVVLPVMAADLDASVYATADYGPYGNARDARVAGACRATFLDSPFLQPPGSVSKADGGSYRVFTPFYRAWQSLDVPDPVPAPQHWPAMDLPRGAGWAVLDAEDDPPFEVGEDAAWHRWRDFGGHGLASYKDRRDLPGASSGLSTALKFGEVHPRSIVADAAGRPGADPFIRQLCWRDFYGHLLAELPQTARHNYQPAFDAFPWDSGARADERFEAWRQGRTGFPYVDAGMRELLATGFMPNRLRMVVASFLVKDLHIDWRRGAAWFMQQLYDGDLANNQHGWQWTAGTGTDAAPYFRIFNPVAQGLRFDPQGEYVRRWVPELRGLNGAAAQEPWEHPAHLRPDYPDRIVDHAVERGEAMTRYEQIKVHGR